MEASAMALAAVVEARPAGARGWHPHGQADASGFAAMGCDELLVHADDVAAALGIDFAPDPVLCERVLRRLFPWGPTDLDPWLGLRWANGRIALAGPPPRARLEGWRWHCAPLAEWDGVVPDFMV